MPSAREPAPAKVNLALHVTGRRDDGFHLLDSLVVFPAIGDEIAAAPGSGLTLEIDGPFAGGLDSGEGNLVLRAARLIGADHLTLRLTKALPVAAGIGGGSTDAAATLRLMARLRGLAMPGVDALPDLGADLPVCLAARSARMSGIGEVVTPVVLPEFWMVLANPGVPVATGAVFAGLGRRRNPPMPDLPGFSDADALFGYLGARRNDLEAAAVALAPPIADALEALAAQPHCRLARMSGSGGTCFALFSAEPQARAAAAAIGRARPGWWVAAAPVR